MFRHTLAALSLVALASGLSLNSLAEETATQPCPNATGNANFYIVLTAKADDDVGAMYQQAITKIEQVGKTEKIAGFSITAKDLSISQSYNRDVFDLNISVSVQYEDSPSAITALFSNVKSSSYTFSSWENECPASGSF